MGRTLERGRNGADPELDDRVEPLLRHLVARITDATPHDPYECDSPADEILLDIEVNGARYVLIRAAAKQVDHQDLSPREQEITRMVAKGYPNKTIAAVLEISLWTVSTHLRRIFAKLNVGSRAAMVARLLREDHLVVGESQRRR
jgi:DNA-binding CsgD family transcriptional regulator